MISLFLSSCNTALAIRRFTGIIPPGGELSLVIKYAIQPKGLPTNIAQTDESIKPSGLPIPPEVNSSGKYFNRQYRSPPSLPSVSTASRTVPVQWNPTSPSSSSYWLSSPPRPHYDVYPLPAPAPYSVHQEGYLRPPNIPVLGSPHSHPTTNPVSSPPYMMVNPSTPLLAPNYSVPPSLGVLGTLSYPTFFTLIVSPVPSSLDILSFPFLRDYGQIVEGKLESILSRSVALSPQSNLPHDINTSTSSSEGFVAQNPQNSVTSPLSSSHLTYNPSLPTHRLVYQVRVESYESAQHIFRLHGTTFQLNGYYMAISILTSSSI